MSSLLRSGPHPSNSRNPTHKRAFLTAHYEDFQNRWSIVALRLTTQAGKGCVPLTDISICVTPQWDRAHPDRTVSVSCVTTWSVT